jgi:YD repeat-containing protein
MLLAATAIATAQVSFGYDAAGNRTSRTIRLTRNSLAAKAAATPEPATEALDGVLVKIYPNPTRGELEVDLAGLPETAGGTVGIYTMQGRLVLEQPVSHLRARLDIAAQPAGTYLMKIDAGGRNTTWKIIKE